jgi:type II secretory pathway pseudopilin PulG
MELPSTALPIAGHQGLGGRGRPGPRVAVALVLVLALLGLLAAAIARRQSPLRQAWRAALLQDTYRLEGETGWQGDAEHGAWRVTGLGHLDGRLAITLSQAADPAAARGEMALALDIAWPEVGLATAEGPGPAPDPHALARALAGGDPLALLAVGEGARAGPWEAVGARDCRAWDFQVGGAAYLSWWREHPGFLPVNADSGGLPTFEAEGRLWQDPTTGLPCRVAARLKLPRVAGEQPGQAWLDWRYEWSGRSDGATTP